MPSSRKAKTTAHSASPTNRVRDKSRVIFKNTRTRARSVSLGKTKNFHNIKSIVHETVVPGLIGILSNGGMQIQVTRQKNNINVVGQGDPTRALNVASYSTTHKDSWKNYTDAHGSFFRVDFNGKKPHVGYDYCSNPVGDVAFVFSPQLLEKTDSWILNTTENNGFYLGTRTGLVGESPFSGYMGITYNNKNIQDFPELKPGMEPIRGDDTELLIFKNIDLTHLKKIIFKTQRLFDLHKDQVTELLKQKGLTHVKLSAC
jgi:hypothetical protein